MRISHCNEFLVVAGAKNVVIYRLANLEAVQHLPLKSPGLCIDILRKDTCIMIGLQDGKLLMLPGMQPE